jgi:hypothetical protein
MYMPAYIDKYTDYAGTCRYMPALLNGYSDIPAYAILTPGYTYMLVW